MGAIRWEIARKSGSNPLPDPPRTVFVRVNGMVPALAAVFWTAPARRRFDSTVGDPSSAGVSLNGGGKAGGIPRAHLATAPGDSLALRGTSGERVGERGRPSRTGATSPRPSPPPDGGEGVQRGGSLGQCANARACARRPKPRGACEKGSGALLPPGGRAFLPAGERLGARSRQRSSPAPPSARRTGKSALPAIPAASSGRAGFPPRCRGGR